MKITNIYNERIQSERIAEDKAQLNEEHTPLFNCVSSLYSISERRVK